MTLTQVITGLQKKEISLPYKSVWRDIYLHLSLYLQGKKPNYNIQKDDIFLQDSGRSDDALIPYTEIYEKEVFSRYPYDTKNMVEFRKSIVAIDDMQALPTKSKEQARSIIFQGNNFFVTTQDRALQNWLDTVIIDGFNFNEWVRIVLFEKLWEDPNAFLCVVESHLLPYFQNEKALPCPKIIPSDRVLYVSRETFVGDRYAIDKQQQILLDVDYTDIDNPKIQDITDNSLVANHKFGELPVVQLGGKFVSPYLWHSFIQPFVGIANRYLQEKSDIDITKKILAPRLVVITALCMVCNGRKVEDGADGPVKCKGCNGTGERLTLNLGSTQSIPEDQAVMDGNKLGNLERFKYYTPDTGYITMLTTDADKEFTRAEKALFIFRKETSAAEAANNLDKQFEEKKIFFQSISERMLYLVNNLLKYVSMYLNYNDGTPKASEFSVAKPIDFDLSSANELLAQYSAEQLAALPLPILNRTERDYVKKIYGEDSVMQKRIEFLQLYDPLYGKPQDVVDTMSGVAALDLAIHNYLAFFLEKYIKAKTPDKFLKTDYETIYTAILPDIEFKVTAQPTLL